MHFGDRQRRDRADRVMYGDRGVGIGASIDDYAGRLLCGLLDPVDQIAFMIGLAKNDLQPQCRTGLPAVLLDASQRRSAIDAGFPLPERVEVGTVQYENRFQYMHLSPRQMPSG